MLDIGIARSRVWRVAIIILTALLSISVAIVVFGQQPANPSPRTVQPEPPGTATISGVVTALGTGAPIAGAAVEGRRGDCGSTGGESATATTGGDGKFVLEKLRSGSWCVGAAHGSGAYTPAEYQQRGYEGRGVPVPLIDGQRLENIDLAMAPTGSISGRILDDDGEPMARARAQVMRASYRDGQRRLYSMNVVQTNDRGEFHFFWLPPGRYYIAAIPEDTDRPRVAYSVAPPGRGGYRADTMPPVIRRRIAPAGEVIEETYAPVYYGGGTDSTKAQPIDVAPVAAIDGIQLTFNGARTRAWHIRGTVPLSVPPTPPPTAGTARGGAQNPPAPPPTQLRLAPRDWTAIAVMPSATADKDGNFDIGGVAPGAYVLYASVNNLSARIPLEVGNANIDNLRVVPAPPFPVSGNLILDNPSLMPATNVLSGLRLTLAREPDFPGLSGGSLNAAVTQEGTFSLPNVPPGDYHVYVPPVFNPFSITRTSASKTFEAAYVKAVRIAGVDALTEGLHLIAAPENPIVVILGLGGGLSGTVTDTQLRPAINVTVALVPEFPRNRPDLYRTAVSDRLGRFQINGIAPGDYRAFAWEEVADGAWFDEEFMRASDFRGKSVRIGEGMQTTIELMAVSQ